MKTLIYFTAFVFSLSFLGCKPKETPKPTETALSGQVFIVTRGAENVKLGLVEVQLLSKEQVCEILKIKSDKIETEISSLQKAFQIAVDKTQKATSNLNSFATDGILENSQYKSLLLEQKKLVDKESQLKIALENHCKERQIADSAKIAAVNIKQYPNGGYQKIFAESLASSQPFVDALSTNERAINEVKIEMINIEADYNSKKNYLENQTAKAHQEVIEAKAKLESYPSAEDYWADFKIVTIQKKLTDADGKFQFSYLQGKALTIMAKAERMVGSKIEKYYWLVDAPSDAEKTQVFLSNNNFASIDPDGYFKIKPKLELQDSKP